MLPPSFPQGSKASPRVRETASGGCASRTQRAPFTDHSGPAVRGVGVAVCVRGFIAAVDCPSSASSRCVNDGDLMVAHGLHFWPGHRTRGHQLLLVVHAFYLRSGMFPVCSGMLAWCCASMQACGRVVVHVCWRARLVHGQAPAFPCRADPRGRAGHLLSRVVRNWKSKVKLRGWPQKVGSSRPRILLGLLVLLGLLCPHSPGGTRRCRRNS